MKECRNLSIRCGSRSLKLRFNRILSPGISKVIDFQQNSPAWPEGDDPWTNISANRAYECAEERQNLLKIQTISDLVPLSPVQDFTHAASAPEALQDILFNHKNPDLSTYAILHAGRFQWGAAELEDCGLPTRCLFQGRAAQTHRDDAPFLVELKEGADFTRRLFTYNPKMPVEMTSLHLWQAEPGMLVRSNASFDEIWAHFRRFTRVKNEQGKWLHFNFWDGSIFVDYWRHFANSSKHVARFFVSPDFQKKIELIYLHKGTLTHFAPNIDAIRSTLEHTTPFSLTPEDHAYFQSCVDVRFKAEICSRLTRKLGDFPNVDAAFTERTVNGAYEYIKHRSRGAPVSHDDCFTLSLLAILWGPNTKAILRGPVLNQPLLGISHRIALAYQSYFEAIKSI